MLSFFELNNSLNLFNNLVSDFKYTGHCDFKVII